jgi:hypothetical protein
MAGVVKAVDSVDFFVQHTAGQDTRDATNLANFTATATGFVSPDQTNTVHKGALLMLNISTLSVNSATLAVNVDGKRGDGVYFNLARLSLDGLTTSLGQSTILVYPGVTAPAVPGNMTAFAIPLPGKYRVTATLSITTTASMSGVAGYSIGQSKIL